MCKTMKTVDRLILYYKSKSTCTLYFFYNEFVKKKTSTREKISDYSQLLHNTQHERNILNKIKICLADI